MMNLAGDSFIPKKKWKIQIVMTIWFALVGITFVGKGVEL